MGVTKEPLGVIVREYDSVTGDFVRLTDKEGQPISDLLDPTTGLNAPSIVGLNGSVAMTVVGDSDLLPMVDISDTTESSVGTTKASAVSTLFTGRTLTNPTLAGTFGIAGALVTPANAMSAFVIDVTKALNTKSISADQTFTFSGTPAAEDTQFTLRVSNSDTLAHALTIPTSKPEGTATTITSVTIPPSSTIYLTWNYHNGVYDLFGTQYAGKHMIPIMAGAMSPSVTGGCAALTAIASAANQPDIRTLDFDATTEEYAQFALPMPESWDEGTLTFQPIWSHASTTTNFGVVWSLQAVAISNDDGIATAFGTAVTSTDTGGTTNDIYIGPESAAMTVAGTPAAGDMVFFRIFRTTANGSDTMAIDARLHGIRLYFTSNSETDA